MPAPKHDIEETPFEVRENRDPEGVPSSAKEQEPAPSIPADEPEAPVGPSAPAQAVELGDHEAKLEDELDELTAKAEKADEYLDLAQRTKADFENYRKRAVREAAAAKERGVAKLALELLPAVDNLDRALEVAEAAGNGENGDTTLVSGIKLVHADVIAALARVGIERYSPQGERFDPQHHEAVAQQLAPGTEPGMIIEVYQRGYRLGDSVLRPAQVVVAG
ncbi:MAG: nucleotide exchange factor GrpE [Solirubrobacteraceae bacterium]